MEKQKEKTAAEIKFEELMGKKHLTTAGRLSCDELVKKFGDPKLVLKYAKVEARTGSVKAPFIVVEKCVDAELQFSLDVVICGFPKDSARRMTTSAVAVEFVRHPTFNVEKMPKATQQEKLKAGLLEV